MYANFVWSLGEIHSEASSGSTIDVKNFTEKPLYKVVNRGGNAYLLILQLFPDSVVYIGSSTGTGLYFETDIVEALYYTTYRDSGRIYDDIVKVPDIDICVSNDIEETINIRLSL